MEGALVFGAHSCRPGTATHEPICERKTNFSLSFALTSSQTQSLKDAVLPCPAVWEPITKEDEVAVV